MPPECLDDFIADDNPVRVVDAFIGELDMVALGFEGATPATTGRPSYHPAVMLKVYLYGYLNRIQSSRRLERECQRNVELMWLTGRLSPDFKTIADFRRDNSAGIGNVCRRFVVLCRNLKLFSQALVAIDGSKFKAVNSRDCNFTNGKIDKRQEQIEEGIQRNLNVLEAADCTQPVELEAKTVRLTVKIARLRQQMRELDAIKEQLKTQPDGQISRTDPDARSMSRGRPLGGQALVVGVNLLSMSEYNGHAHHPVAHVSVKRESRRVCDQTGLFFELANRAARSAQQSKAALRPAPIELTLRKVSSSKINTNPHFIKRTCPVF